MNDIPTRPGTLWTPSEPWSAFMTCAHCHKGYNSHGAPEDIAKQFKVPLDKRHLICPASDDAWAEYFRRQQRAAVAKCIQAIERDLSFFSEEEQSEIVTALQWMVKR